MDILRELPKIPKLQMHKVFELKKQKALKSERYTSRSCSERYSIDSDNKSRTCRISGDINHLIFSERKNDVYSHFDHIREEIEQFNIDYTLFDNPIRSLDLSALELQVIPSLNEVSNLDCLFMSRNNIPVIDLSQHKQFNGLKCLIMCSSNIKTITYLPPTLSFLDISENQILSLRDIYLPEHIEILYASNNKINDIWWKSMPKYMVKLHLEGNEICKIHHIPPNVQFLELSSNYIKYIPKLGKKLQTLCLNKNKIVNIRNISSSLRNLYLTENKISVLLNLPEGLIALDISDNEITKIQNLPNSLEYLYISDNFLSKIENLPIKLIELDVSGNDIIEISNIPYSVQKLHIADVPIEIIDMWNNKSSMQIFGPFDEYISWEEMMNLQKRKD